MNHNIKKTFFLNVENTHCEKIYKMIIKIWNKAKLTKKNSIFEVIIMFITFHMMYNCFFQFSQLNMQNYILKNQNYLKPCTWALNFKKIILMCNVIYKH